jgi:hypothetical protein
MYVNENSLQGLPGVPERLVWAIALMGMLLLVTYVSV